ncbi:MAG: putative glycolipid-binding domain-containing protein [Gemmatimonadetes bacterium]|nr:putative glycolipid-binding domain-containing protein [Gemmatimonadota bacterium]
MVESGAGISLDGEVLTLHVGAPATIRYRVRCSVTWQTESCVVRVRLRNENIVLDLVRDPDDRWAESGQPLHDLNGCTDVDLGFSPCTNTLPIRRLGLQVGERQRIAAAWLRFPQLDVVRSDQVYTRLTDRRYRYESGDGRFRADLDVDETGLVTKYGDLWRELTTGTE